MFEKPHSEETGVQPKSLAERLAEKYDIDQGALDGKNIVEAEKYIIEGGKYIEQEYLKALKLEQYSYFNNMFLDLLDDPDIESVFAKVAKFNEHKEWDDPRNTTLPNLEVFDRGLNKSGAHSIGIRLSEDGTVTFKVTR